MGLDIDITKNISQNNKLIKSKEIYYSDSFEVMSWLDDKLYFNDDEFSKEIPLNIIFELYEVLKNIENLENSNKKNALKKAKFLFYHDNLKHDHPKDIKMVHDLFSSLKKEVELLKNTNNSNSHISYIYTRTY